MSLGELRSSRPGSRLAAGRWGHSIRLRPLLSGESIAPAPGQAAAERTPLQHAPVWPGTGLSRLPGVRLPDRQRAFQQGLTQAPGVLKVALHGVDHGVHQEDIGPSGPPGKMNDLEKLVEVVSVPEVGEGSPEVAQSLVELIYVPTVVMNVLIGHNSHLFRDENCCPDPL